MKAVVGPDHDGQRIDRVVAAVTGLSRAVTLTMVRDGSVLLDGQVVPPRHRTTAGQTLDITLPEPVEDLDPEDLPLSVVYEDDEIAVIDKPAGMVVHPGAGRRRGTLAAAVLHRWPAVRGVGEPGRWGIVHRLDVDTSGLLVVALTHRALDELQRSLKARRVTRVYVALVVGEDLPPSGTIEAPIGRDPHRPTRFRVDPEGRAARTHYRRLAVWPGVSLLEVSLETGRTHQIRVHAASIGHPVAGDGAYGAPPGPSPRIWLHAARIGFAHPQSGETIEVSAPLPADLIEGLETIGSPMDGEIPAELLGR
jgi:23S rRNA pseudouridine1911/1915/1917 synthase